MNNIDDFVGVCFGLAILVISLFTMAILYFGVSHGDELSTQQRHYCEMVAIFDQSGGEYGWPPFEGREACRDE